MQNRACQRSSHALDILPLPQRALWAELDATPDHFTLYGGTALALRLGHRRSVDFYFFSRTAFSPGDLAREIPYLAGAEQVQVVSDTLTCRVERGGRCWRPSSWAARLGASRRTISPKGRIACGCIVALPARTRSPCSNVLERGVLRH
jgi:hypothetical protein